MLDRFVYFATTFAEGILAVAGVHGVFEQPAYTVRPSPIAGLEIRDYGPLVAVETISAGEEDAFKRLFAYITGANDGGRMIAMTAPVQQTPALIPMTTPVRKDVAADGAVTMRFFLPAKLAAHPPVPTDPQVRLAQMPPTTVAVVRFSGNPTPAWRAEHERQLLERLAASTWKAKGAPYFLSYDPPFAVPFLKRNEVAVTVEQR